MAEVSLSKLNKMFDTNHVVKDVDLEVDVLHGMMQRPVVLVYLAEGYRRHRMLILLPPRGGEAGRGGYRQSSQPLS